MNEDEQKFTREKTAFEHNASQMRALNDQMSRVPTASITITGGLWFAAAQVQSTETSIKFWILLFACVANIALILAAIRVRDVLQSYIEVIERFAPGQFGRGVPKSPILGKFVSYSMIFIYCSLMAAAAVMSLIGAILFYWPANQQSVAFIGILLVVAFVLLLLLKVIGVGKRDADA